MATIRLGNLLWRNRTTPISQDDPLDTRDINSESIKTTLQQVQQLLSGVATEAKLEQARALLANLNAKDFATQATLAAVKSELEVLKAELQAIKANQLSGEQKVTLSGNIMEIYGATVADRPPANSVPIGATYMAVNTQEVWQSNGIEWVVM